MTSEIAYSKAGNYNPAYVFVIRVNIGCEKKGENKRTYDADLFNHVMYRVLILTPKWALGEPLLVTGKLLKLRL